MKQINLGFKRYQTHLTVALVIVSFALTVYDWTHVQNIWDHLKHVGWIGLGLLVTEVVFIVGAFCMAIGAGEDVAAMRHVRNWPRHFRLVRKNVRALAGHILNNPIFELGFWLNFAGAVGTSLILIVGVLMIAPTTSEGIIALILIDLVATFGWRVPLEIARRKARKNGIN